MKKNLYLMLITALVVFTLDQLSKWWIQSNMQVGQQIPIVDGLLQLRYTHNTGAAFGLFRDGSGILSILSPLVIVGIVVTFMRVGHPSRLGAMAAGLVVGGALGNLADRLRLGYVVDFVEATGARVDLGGTIYTFPVFNVGDSGITIGVILILIGLLFAKDDSEAHRVEQPQVRQSADDQPSATSNATNSNHTNLAG